MKINFFKEFDPLRPCITSKEGIFLAGTTTGPKDILNTISHAKGAACETLTYLGGKKVIEININPEVLIIGGGVAGIAAAQKNKKTGIFSNHPGHGTGF